MKGFWIWVKIFESKLDLGFGWNLGVKKLTFSRRLLFVFEINGVYKKMDASLNKSQTLFPSIFCFDVGTFSNLFTRTFALDTKLCKSTSSIIAWFFMASEVT